MRFFILYLLIQSIFITQLYSLDKIKKCPTEFYNISGKTEAELLTNMKKKNNVPGGYFAYTSYSWKSQCREVQLTCKVRLPKWTNYNEGNPELKEKWEQFYNATVAHELGHVDIFFRHFNRAKETAKNKLCNQATDLFYETSKTVQKEQISYDKKTNHGIKTGAVFGTDFFQSIAYSSSTDTISLSKDHPNQKQAEDEALKNCKEEDCKILIWSKNACASVAFGEDGKYGYNWGNSKKESEKNTIETCDRYTQNCKIRKTICPSYMEKSK